MLQYAINPSHLVNYVKAYLGEYFISYDFGLDFQIQNLNFDIPLVMWQKEDSNPIIQLSNAAKAYEKDLQILCLGEGQEEVARKTLKHCLERDQWLCILQANQDNVELVHQLEIQYLQYRDTFVSNFQLDLHKMNSLVGTMDDEMAQTNDS